MNSAGDIADNADIIAGATSTGYMPPWPAGDGDLKFHGDRRLSDEDRNKILDWAKQNDLDVDRSTKITPTRDAAAPIERDAAMTAQPYHGSAAKGDDYRCQVYDPHLTKPEWLQGLSVEPDQTRVVHHALIFRARAETLTAAQQTDAAEDGPGWTCVGPTGLGGDAEATQQIQSWAPGQQPTSFPKDTGLLMQPGDYFILQIHYHYTAETESLPADLTRLVADFASDEVVAAAGGRLQPVTLTLYLGPAEIPCATDETGPLCDRNASIASTGHSSFAADGLMAQCGKTLADFAGMTDGHPTSTCDHAATPGKIVSIWGHMHEIGSTIKLTLNPGTPGERVLLDITKWDFDWQLDYEPIDDVILKADDVIRVECSWDRSKIRKGAEPRYIYWSEGTDDEMCFSQIITRPSEPPLTTASPTSTVVAS